MFKRLRKRRAKIEKEVKKRGERREKEQLPWEPMIPHDLKYLYYSLFRPGDRNFKF